MTTTPGMVVAIFDDRTQAELAVNDLENAGFSPDQIRFAGHGAASGGVLDKIKNLFTGHETGAAYNDLVSMGVPADDANYYQHEYEVGHSIVTVVANGQTQQARDILARDGGYGAGSRRFEQTSTTAATAGTTSTTGTTGRPRMGMPETGTEGEQRLKLREEELRAQKQPVEQGEARLRKDVVSEQKNIDVPVTREEVYVEHRPGSGQPSDKPIGEGETYRIPVREEQITADKRTVETGEVVIGKRPVQETRRVSDTVRREKAHVEHSGDVDIQGNDARDISDQSDQTTP